MCPLVCALSFSLSLLHTHSHTYTQTYTPTHTHARKHASTHTHSLSHTHVHTHKRTHARMHACTCKHARTCISTTSNTKKRQSPPRLPPPKYNDYAIAKSNKMRRNLMGFWDLVSIPAPDQNPTKCVRHTCCQQTHLCKARCTSNAAVRRQQNSRNVWMGRVTRMNESYCACMHEL